MYFQQKPPFVNSKLRITDPAAANLVAAWVFSEGSYNVYDRSLRWNNLTAGAPSTPINIVDGLHDCPAMKFDGSTQFLQISTGTPATLQFVDQFTISTWIRLDTQSGADYIPIYSCYSAATSKSGYRLSYNLSGTGPYSLTLKLEFANSTFAAVSVSSSIFSVSALAQWAHIVVTFNAGAVIFQFNGVENSQTASSSSIGYNVTTTPVYVAHDPNVGAFFFGGALESLFLHNRALTSGEIGRIYNKPYPMFVSYDAPSELTPVLGLIPSSTTFTPSGGVLGGGSAIITETVNISSTGNGALGGTTGTFYEAFNPTTTGVGVLGGSSAQPFYSFANSGIGGALGGGTADQGEEIHGFLGGSADVWVDYNPFILNTGVYSGLSLPPGRRTTALVQYTGNLTTTGNGVIGNSPHVESVIDSLIVASGGAIANNTTGNISIAPYIQSTGVLGNGTSAGLEILNPQMEGGAKGSGTPTLNFIYVSNVPSGGSLGGGAAFTQVITSRFTTGNGGVGNGTAGNQMNFNPSITGNGGVGGGTATTTSIYASPVTAAGALGGGSGTIGIQPVISGGAVGGGSAAFGRTYVNTGQSGAIANGTPTILFDYSPPESGGSVAGGTMGFAYTSNILVSSGAIVGGAAESSEPVSHYVASGTILVNSGAKVSAQVFLNANLDASSELILMGGGAKTFWGYETTATGTVVIDGSVVVNSLGYKYRPNGTVVISGVAGVHTNFYEYNASGQITMGGSSSFAFTYNDIPCVGPGLLCPTVFPVPHNECSQESAFYGECVVFNRPGRCRSGSIAILPAITGCRQKGFLPPKDRHVKIPKR